LNEDHSTANAEFAANTENNNAIVNRRFIIIGTPVKQIYF